MTTKTQTNTRLPKENKLLALGPSDPELAAPHVESSFSMVPELARKIEPVGKFYAQLQNRVAKGYFAPLNDEE